MDVARMFAKSGRFDAMQGGGGSESGTRATTIAREDGHGRRLLAFWKSGSASFDLPEHGTVVVGRGTDCDVRIDHPSVSRRHAKLHLGPGVTVEDLGSSNGTSIAGRALARGSTTPVQPGMVIELGSAMLLVQGADASRGRVDGARELTPPTGDRIDRTDREARAERSGGPRTTRALVVEDSTMDQLHRLAEMVAKSTISVILLGETGVGKEVLAETIHRRSPRGRANKPFVRLNCAAMPDNLLESELFGYERGAFTGAVAAKPGLLESADGGTVFLDEIGELPLATQAKLLRVLESGEVSRVGSLKPRAIDVRFLSATNRDVEELAAARLFRQDLYFRLNGISIQIPPLRERTGEIAPLARAFADEACKKAGKPLVTVADEAIARLEQHDWPGNVRELKNVVERAVLMGEGGTLLARHVSIGKMTAESAGASAARAVTPAPSSRSGARALDGEAASERQRILDALEQTGGNQKEAAKVLGISRRTLVYRLDTYDVPRPRKR